MPLRQMRRISAWAAIALLQATLVDCATAQQATGTIAPPERPVFGNRPIGQGFRPQAAGGGPGLLGARGLQDAMSAARANPLAPRPVVVIPAQDPAVTQAIQALRTMQETRRQLLTARAGGRTRASLIVPHIVGYELPAGERVDIESIRGRIDRITGQTQRAEPSLHVRREGNRVVLEGTVASTEEQRLVERLVRLEPGVYDVENRVQVQPAPPRLQ